MLRSTASAEQAELMIPLPPMKRTLSAVTIDRSPHRYAQ